MIKEILNAQRNYFEAGRTLDVNTRLRFLKALKAEIKARENLICAALKSDLGKSPSEAYMSEIGMVLEDLSCHIKHLKKWSKPAKKHTPLAQFPAKSYVMPVPYGNTLIISPWNYPFLLSVQPLVGAIAAGNTVILKPSRASAQTSAAIKELIESVFPQELAAVAFGESINDEILGEKFDYIFFTGGKEIGRKVYKAAAENLTPVTLELGGKSPVIVDKTAKLDLATRRIVFGKFLNVGQTCVAPDYVIAHKSIAAELVKRVEKYINKLYPDALASESYGKIISERHYERVKRLIGGNVVLGGSYDDEARKIEPTVIYPATLSDPAMQEEIFGPILPVLTYETDSELFTVIERNPTPLALYLFTTDKRMQKQALSRIRFGGGCVNDTIMHIASTSIPFGGVGGSGIGSYHGQKSFQTFSHYKSILKKSNALDLPVRYTPYTKGKDKLIRFFMK